MNQQASRSRSAYRRSMFDVYGLTSANQLEILAETGCIRATKIYIYVFLTKCLLLYLPLIGTEMTFVADQIILSKKFNLDVL